MGKSIVEEIVVEEEVSDIRYRAEAVKEATKLFKIATSVKSADDSLTAVRLNGMTTASQLVDEILKVASFLLGESNSGAPVTNYVDQYHYHYDGTGNEITE